MTHITHGTASAIKQPKSLLEKDISGTRKIDHLNTNWFTANADKHLASPYNAYQNDIIGGALKTRSVQVRLTEAEYADLCATAAAQKTTMASLLRAYMHESLAGFDRNTHALLEQLHAIRRELEITKSLSASAVGAIAMFDLSRHSAASIQDIRKNLDESFGIALAAEQLLVQFQQPVSGKG